MRTIVLSIVVLSGCATIHDERSVPVFGRAALTDAPACEVSLVRGPTPAGVQVATRMLEGSIFLGAVEAEQLLRREACSVGANVVHIASETYGVPFFGTQVVAVLLRQNPT